MLRVCAFAKPVTSMVLQHSVGQSVDNVWWELGERGRGGETERRPCVTCRTSAGERPPGAVVWHAAIERHSAGPGRAVVDRRAGRQALPYEGSRIFQNINSIVTGVVRRRRLSLGAANAKEAERARAGYSSIACTLLPLKYASTCRCCGSFLCIAS